MRNGLLLCESIEKAYDRGRVCFVYNPLEGRFYFRVLDDQLRSEKALPSGFTLEQLNGRPLCLPPGKIPYRRVLALQGREALYHAKTEYEYNASEADEEAIVEALNLSDRVSHDEDERERVEGSLGNSEQNTSKKNASDDSEQNIPNRDSCYDLSGDIGFEFLTDSAADERDDD